MSCTFFNAGEIEKTGFEDCIFLYIELKIASRSQPIHAQTLPLFLDCINSLNFSDLL